ncbi:hypothetical protein EVAR_88684_1 [Eumeta japonica]|uniref:Uncharacterized protein n=1 Tax=Eumeta variegata TaxID=151549 RepID=A0A4C1Y152_EUMVA|nr:hypothetical protein EVAR_88684_1 [Eumeta japonica]
MSQGTASIIGFGPRTTAAAIMGTTAQYVNVTSKSFPTGNILHNAIVSRNVINRANLTPSTSGISYSVTAIRPVFHTTTSKVTSVVSTSANDFDTISTTKDMIDNACNSSVMLKKVLTLGSAGTAKSFMMQNTQKVLSTGFASGVSAPPNVTIVSSGSGGIPSVPVAAVVSNGASPTSSTLSATHATLSALLASSGENIQPGKK